MLKLNLQNLTMIDILLCLGLIASVVFLVLFLYKIFNAAARTNFSRQYKITQIPKSVKVQKYNNAKTYYFELNYPFWAVSKEDSTADKRYSNNKIIWKKSFLYVDKNKLSSDYPDDILKVVHLLREVNVHIEPNDLEKAKIARLKEEKEIFLRSAKIQEIVNFFSEKPTDFEKFCANLFRKMGYTAELTPPTNDGGYDILLTKENQKTIVECKCYQPKYNIGRPAIQKLVGANQITAADKMIFITTSDFSSGALTYAKKTGVDLINGLKLVELLKAQGFYQESKISIAPKEWQLQVRDLRPYIPKDIYEEYFH